MSNTFKDGYLLPITDINGKQIKIGDMIKTWTPYNEYPRYGKVKEFDTFGSQRYHFIGIQLTHISFYEETEENPEIEKMHSDEIISFDPLVIMIMDRTDPGHVGRRKFEVIDDEETLNNIYNCQ